MRIHGMNGASMDQKELNLAQKMQC
jgi:hypothetical protein